MKTSQSGGVWQIDVIWYVERVETIGADRPNMRRVKARVRSLFRVHFAAFVNFVPFLDCGLRLHAQLSVRTAPMFGLRAVVTTPSKAFNKWPRAPGGLTNARRPNSEVAVLVKKAGRGRHKTTTP